MEKVSFHRQLSIEKGWSGDRKFKATDEKGTPVLLRISPAERQEGRQKLFAQVCRLPEDIPMSRPIEFGLCDEGVYTTWTWIEGEDAENIIPMLLEEVQYAQVPDGKYKIVGTRKTHVMKPGDYITRIALKEYGDKEMAQYIIVHNAFPNPDKVPIGQEIKLPELQEIE